MSCHSIGAALNNVSKTVLNLLDEDKISKEAAKEILYKTRTSVHFCDGNEYEATEEIDDNYCGYCLKKMKKNDLFLQLCHTSNNINNQYEIVKKYKMASYRVCSNCFDKLLNETTGDETTGEREKQYIMEHYDEYDYRK